jgi:hypothetical protein
MMSHEILPGPNANIVIFRLIGDLTYADMTCDQELGLNDGRPLYVLLDGAKTNVGLPEQFLDGAKRSWFVNENLAHLALYLESSLLRTIGLMVAKMTRRSDKLSLHDSYDAALKHLLKLEAKERV